MSKPTLAAIALIGLASCLSGCQPMAHLLSAPLALQVGKVDASTLTPSADPQERMTLLYATTRQPLGGSATRQYGESVADELRLGVATLRVDGTSPDARELRALPSISSVKDRPALRLDSLDELGAVRVGAPGDVLSPETLRFFGEIDRALSASTDKDVFVYVHGANNSVYRTAAQAAQYRQFTGRASVVVAFVWPTVDNYLSYATDVRNARGSVPGFVQLLELLAMHTNAEHINILAHSAGSRIVSAALAQMGDSASGVDRDGLRRKLRLGEVYYAAADIETQAFVQDLREYVDLPLRITLQANRSDLVLAYLAFSSGHSRAGRPNLNDLDDAQRAWLREWIAASRLDVVDVASERAGDLPGPSHAFWYERRWVSSDVALEFVYHAPPAARGLEAADRDGLKRWVFPSDYEERASAAVEKLSAR